MAEKLTLCLVGPTRSGKSSLLASLTDCAVQGAHGYPPETRPSIHAISRAEFDAAGGENLEILDDLANAYEKLRRDFAESDQPSATGVNEYFFKLTLGAGAPAELLARAPYFLNVIDASGDLVVSSGEPPAFLRDGAREAFGAKLLEADAIIFVLPSLRLEDCAWAGSVARLIERIAQALAKKTKRLVVVFSQYERLFTPLGPSAFTYACDPAVALYATRKLLRAARWLESLRELESGGSGVTVRFCVASAFGFTKTFQNPNIDPRQDNDRRFRRAGAAGGRALTEFWRPFLAADPFLCAALGLDGAFTFSHAQIDQARFEQEERVGFG